MSKYNEALRELNNMLADKDNYSAEEKQTTYNVIKEAIEKAEKYDIYLRNKHISIFDKLNDTRKTIESVEQERDDSLKRIAELEAENKVLKDGVKALNEILKIKLVKNEYSIEQYDMELSRVGCLCGFDNDDQFEDVKAMLEVVCDDNK